jgi:transposase InsO family protein
MKMCQELTVSKSGYYAWKSRGPSNRSLADTVLKVEILDTFWLSRFINGILGTLNALMRRGIRCGHNRVRRLLRELGLYPKTIKKFKATTNSKHSLPVSPDLLGQDFTASAPDQKWVTDITYIKTGEGWLYLCVFIDLYSRMVVGWAMGDRMTSDLVTRAFLHAAMRRNPLPGLIVHSDRGSQYASAVFRALLVKYHALSSMSKKGDCYDNAVAESFFGSLKTELVYHENYETRKEARSSIFEHIEVGLAE